MQLPAPIQVRILWRPGVSVPAPLRERLADEVETLSWELSQTEALLQDVIRVAASDRAFLMPRIELRLPLFDENRRFRLVFSHIEKARITLVDEEGKRLADLAIV